MCLCVNLIEFKRVGKKMMMMMMIVIELFVSLFTFRLKLNKSSGKEVDWLTR